MKEFQPIDIRDLGKALKEFNSDSPAYAIETDDDVIFTNQHFLVALPGHLITDNPDLGPPYVVEFV